MNNDINNNFGLRGPSPEENQSLANMRQYKNEKNVSLRFAIKEVEIGSPDSIAIAVNALRLQKIEISSLNLLLKLHEDTQGPNRTAKFAENAHQLQQTVINEIKLMLF
jgi:hypothetical protein